MHRREASDCMIEYDGDRITLRGAADTIHLEAGKILRRFAHSGTPYAVKRDSAHGIVLARFIEHDGWTQ